MFFPYFYGLYLLKYKRKTIGKERSIYKNNEFFENYFLIVSIERS